MAVAASPTRLLEDDREPGALEAALGAARIERRSEEIGVDPCQLADLNRQLGNAAGWTWRDRALRLVEEGVDE